MSQRRVTGVPLIEILDFIRQSHAAGAYNYPRDETHIVTRKEGEGMTVKTTIQLETGEKREGTSASSRVFFVYVTPTGAELPITKAPGLVKVWSKTNGGFEGSSRHTVTEYEVRSPITIKMVNLQSTFGSPRRVVNLMIKLDGDEATIDLYGLDKFGRFKGRGKVDMAASSFYMNRESVRVDLEMLKREFYLTMLQPPKKAGACKAPRSLIFE